MSERLFVALWPPSEVVECLDDALVGARSRYQHLRWQPPARWHITLAFLGERSLSRQITRFEKITPGTAEQIELIGAGHFGPVLWIGVRHGDWLTRLARDVRTGMAVDERRFQAHITVGRARTEPARRELSSALAELGSIHCPAWTPSEITLVHSVPGPAPEYVVVARTSLAVDDL